MNELSVIEKRELRECERVIQHAVDSSIKAGQELRKIHDRKLYVDYGTFDKYIQKRWNFERTYAYRLMTASEIKDDLLTIGNIEVADAIQTEGQARELAKVADDVLPVVVEKLAETMAETGKPLTAKVIKQVVAEVCEPEPEPEPEPAPVDDMAAERARAKVPVLVKGLRFHLGNLGDTGRWDKPLREMLDFAK